jgi:LPXTG-site transpeptidase (sortase) family protein
MPETSHLSVHIPYKSVAYRLSRKAHLSQEEEQKNVIHIPASDSCLLSVRKRRAPKKYVAPVSTYTSISIPRTKKRYNRNSFSEGRKIPKFVPAQTKIPSKTFSISHLSPKEETLSFHIKNIFLAGEYVSQRKYTTRTFKPLIISPFFSPVSKHLLQIEKKKKRILSQSFRITRKIHPKQDTHRHKKRRMSSFRLQRIPIPKERALCIIPIHNALIPYKKKTGLKGKTYSSFQRIRTNRRGYTKNIFPFEKISPITKRQKEISLQENIYVDSHQEYERNPRKSLSCSSDVPKTFSKDTPKRSRTSIPRFFQKKKTKKEQKGLLREIVQFSITTSIVFLSSFFVMNASALSELFSAKLNPVATVEKQIALTNITTEKRFVSVLPTDEVKYKNHAEFPPLNLNIGPLENRIVIPKIGKNVPVVHVSPKALQEGNWKQLEVDIQAALRNGVVHYPGTARPGEIGNVFITGHSSYYLWDPGKYKDVFVRLHDLKAGDEFTIFWNQDIYHYKIKERKVVTPEETSVLKQPHDKKIATLMTCTPVGTAKNRLVLVAEQI